ncbi:hypothetical protein GGR51DRAFT_530076 [Nemania sp. FL0031]|nr:hypothetical protein GGR51DRAFT_530076 [Nemania sp. FL0031]
MAISGTQHFEIQCMKMLDLIERKARPEPEPQHTSRIDDVYHPLDDSFEGWRMGELNKSVSGRAGITEMKTEYTNNGRKMMASITVTPDFCGACNKLVSQLTAFSGRLEDSFPQQSLQPGEVGLESDHNLPRLAILWAYHNVCIKIQLFQPQSNPNPTEAAIKELYTLADKALQNIKSEMDSKKTREQSSEPRLGLRI